MAPRFDPESVDLRELVRALLRVSELSAVGAVVGRTHLRDEVARHLGCSMLEAERLVDTMVARGFVAQRKADDGLVHWVVRDEGAADG